jgi:hypothetical protein
MSWTRPRFFPRANSRNLTVRPPLYGLAPWARLPSREQQGLWCESVGERVARTWAARSSTPNLELKRFALGWLVDRSNWMRITGPLTTHRSALLPIISSPGGWQADTRAQCVDRLVEDA